MSEIEYITECLQNHPQLCHASNIIVKAGSKLSADARKAMKNGNPYTRFVAVAERYDVSLSVAPSYSRIDQIYVLRKGMRKGEWANIDADVTLRLFNETLHHLERPWSDVQKRLDEEGVII